MFDFQSYLSAMLEEGKQAGAFPAAAAAMGVKDQVLAKAFMGEAPLPGDAAVDEHTRWDMASLSKVLGPTMVALKAIENGTLSLDERVGDFFPDAPEDKRDITVFMLMTHTGGFNPSFRLDRMLTDPKDVTECILRYPLDETPGKRPIYSCMGYILFAKMLEKRFGKLDIKAVHGEKGYSTKERTGIRPCLDVCGMWGGHTGEGSKTVLPSKAYAKISTRLVANQDYQKISRLFQEYFESIAPDCVTVKVTPSHGGAAYVSPLEMKAYKAAEKAMEKTFGKRPIPTRSGGSIPIVAGFEKILGIKSILMGFGLGSDDIHAPNENYPLFNFFKGIETIPYFYEYFAQM